MAAAGMADGAYRLGSLSVDVVDGIARVAGTDTIAGSTATMDQVFRFAVAQQRAAARRGTAGRGPPVVGQPGPGAGPARPAGLAAGAAADLVVLDDALTVTGVLHAGSWVVQPG